MSQINVDEVASQMAAKIIEVLSGYGRDIASYAETEGQKIARSIAQIATLRAQGIIDNEESRLHLEIQKNATRAVFMAIEGISIIAAEQAINAALGVVRSAVNTAIGFSLL